MPINSWKVPIPTKKLRDDYELKKNHFTMTLNKEIQRVLNKIEKPTVAPRRELTYLQAKVYELIQTGVTSPTEIGKTLGISKQSAWMNTMYIKNKGYPIEIGQNTVEKAVLETK